MSFNSPTRTGVPLLVDSQVANSVDFHIAATNFLKILDTYLNEVAVGYAHNFSQQTNDPITKEAEFFRDLNNGTLNLQGKEAGINPNVTSTLTVKIDAQLHSTEVWKTNDGIVESRLNTTTGVIEYLAIDTKTSTTRWVPIEQDVLNTIKDKTANLDSAYGIEKMSEEFVLYWIEKFKTAHATVRDAYKQLVTDSTTDMFTDFSDSMGLLTRISDNIDSTVLPLSDPELDRLNLIPRPYNAVLDDKISDNTKLLIFDMSKKNSVLFRNNLFQLLNVTTTNSLPHGENLVTDELYYKRVKQLSDELNGYVADALGKVANMMFYLRTLANTNQQATIDITYNEVIEESIVQVDLLKNKVQQIPSLRTTVGLLSAQRQ